MRESDDAAPTWTPLLILVTLVVTLRVAYLVWLSPYEIVADEGQYWDWSRRLDASYYSKGPGVAWLIAASTALFGVHEWSVRLPAALASGVAALAVGRLGMESMGRRVGLLAALLFCVVPAYQLAAILMTIDSPYIACWALSAWAAWRIAQRQINGTPRLAPWIALGAALGVGFLFKYTIVLLVPGLLAFAWIRRRELAWQRQAALHAAVAAAIVVVAVSPIWIWNSRHGWAGVGHLLGFFDPPGDAGAAVSARSRLMWPVTYVLSQVGGFGPLLALMYLSYRSSQSAIRNPQSAMRAFLLYCAAPTLLFFLAVSLRTSVEGNWPMGAFTTLLIPSAQLIVANNERPGGELADSKARRSVHRWVQATVLFSLIAVVVIHVPGLAARIPLVGRYVPEHRFKGFAIRARRAAEDLKQTRGRAGQEPMVIALTHNDAGRLAFYLPDHPVVFSAGRYFGDRQSSYDFFADTDLRSPMVRGRPAFLFGGNQQVWQTALAFDVVEPLSNADPHFIGLGYHGVRSAGCQVLGVGCGGDQ